MSTITLKSLKAWNLKLGECVERYGKRRWLFNLWGQTNATMLALYGEEGIKNIEAEIADYDDCKSFLQKVLRRLTIDWHIEEKRALVMMSQLRDLHTEVKRTVALELENGRAASLSLEAFNRINQKINQIKQSHQKLSYFSMLRHQLNNLFVAFKAISPQTQKGRINSEWSREREQTNLALQSSPASSLQPHRERLPQDKCQNHSRNIQATSLEKFLSLGGFVDIFISHIAPKLVEPRDVLNVSHSCAFFRKYMPYEQFAHAIKQLTSRNHNNIETLLKNLDERNLPLPGERKKLKAVVVSRGFGGETASQLKMQMINSFASDNYQRLIGADFKLELIKVLSSEFWLQLWDTAGSLNKLNWEKCYFKNADIMYVVCNASYSGMLCEWIQGIRDNTPTNVTIVLLMVSDSFTNRHNIREERQKFQELEVDHILYVDLQYKGTIVSAFNQGIATHIDKLYPIKQSNCNNTCLIV